MSLLDEIAARIGAMSPDERSDLVAHVAPLQAKMRFVPLPGPQTEAYLSNADVLLYGGEAGGGKSFLSMGLAAQEHRHSIIFRREGSQTDGLERAGKEIIGDSARFNGSEYGEWNWPDGRSCKLAGLKEPGDWAKHAGRERDLLVFDEAGEFLRSQVSSLFAWLRGPEGQRTRVLLPSNPPRSTDGYWLTEWFAPWLDVNHPMRAEPGELRWGILDGEGTIHWQEGPEEVEFDGELRAPLSFTFIPAKLKDNPYRDTPEYRRSLDSLPEPLRSQLKHGDWTAGVTDDLNQCIPTAWVKAAQTRWSEARPAGVPQCAIGVDVAQGGLDKTVIAIRYDDWFAPLESVPGAETPGGADVAGKVLARRRDGSKVIVDLGGGWGGDAVRHLASNIGQENVSGYMGVTDSTKRTQDQLLRFFNVRTEAYWRLREALDPSQDGGAHIMLPPDKELLSDLSSPTFETKPGKGGMIIQLEPKDKLVKRLGRSPDKGDAVVMCWWLGAKNVTDGQAWRETAKHLAKRGNGFRPQVQLGRQPLSAKRRA